MSHYDELRERDASMTEDEKQDKYSADKARNRCMEYKDILKNSLLRRYLDKHSDLKGCEYEHSEGYWNKHTEEMLRLIKKSDKKIKGE